MSRHLLLSLSLCGVLASCGGSDPGLEQRLREAEAELAAVRKEAEKKSERQLEVIAKKREEITALKMKLDRVPPPRQVPDDDIRSTPARTPPAPTRTPPAPAPTPPRPAIQHPKGSIFQEGGAEYFIGSDEVKRRVFRRADGLPFVKLPDGKVRLLLGTESQ